MRNLNQEVAVIGIGMTKIGEHWETDLRDLMIEAGDLALMDANVDGEDIDAIFIGNMSAGLFIGQEHLGALAADYDALTPKPSTRIEAADASGGAAIRMGYLAIKSGEFDIVLVNGVEKMSDLPVEEVISAIGTSSDQSWERNFGATFASLWAMIARLHMHEYGTTREQMAQVIVKNHKNAVQNPLAQFRFPVTIEGVLRTGMLADPLTNLDGAAWADGAAAVVLCRADYAKKFTDTPVLISGSGQASDTIAIHDRRDITTMDAVIKASKIAYDQAKITPEDVDVAELHDSFSIAEIMAIEDLDFVPKGQGGPSVEDGLTKIGGKIPCNTSGGLKARGHPLGATGVAQVFEVVQQLRGEANGRQVDGATIGLTQSLGGTGGTAVVHIFKRR